MVFRPLSATCSSLDLVEVMVFEREDIIEVDSDDDSDGEGPPMTNAEVNVALCATRGCVH
jgi:hypothetical protein